MGGGVSVGVLVQLGKVTARVGAAVRQGPSWVPSQVDPEDRRGDSAWDMAGVEDSLRGARPVQGGELNDWKIFLQPVSLWPPTPQRRVAGFANCRGAGREAGLAVVGVAGSSPGMASGLARPRPFQAPPALSGPFG